MGVINKVGSAVAWICDKPRETELYQRLSITALVGNGHAILSAGAESRNSFSL